MASREQQNMEIERQAKRIQELERKNKSLSDKNGLLNEIIANQKDKISILNTRLYNIEKRRKLSWFWLIGWFVRIFVVVSQEWAETMGLTHKENVHGDMINNLNCRSIWENKRGRTYRVKEYVEIKSKKVKN